jgi:glutathione synthase/RimK-type ligase-like ATP-grasp enzyme
MRICLVTCRAYPTLSSSDALYARALEDRGCDVLPLPWNLTPIADFSAGDAIVLRATWDAPDDMAGFERWCKAVETFGRPIFNSPVLACWNNDKRTLLEFGACGIAIPQTIPLDNDTNVDEALSRLQGEWAVIKPCWGGSGAGVERIRSTDAPAVAAARARLNRPFMLQEYLPEIENGELSFVLIQGRLAHAILKRPKPDEFRINSKYEPLAPMHVTPSDALVDDAEAVLRKVLPEAPLYARVDGIERRGRLICTEVELTDPSLYMDIVPGTAHLLADATLAAINATC